MASPRDVVVGANPGLVDDSTSPGWTTGVSTKLADGGIAIYVRATSTIAQYDAVGLAYDSSAVGGVGAFPLSTTNSQTTSRGVAFAQTAIASSKYGWVQQGGRPLVKCLANCGDQVPLYTTATAGSLDDATVSGGLVGGAVPETSISNATAVTINVALGGFIVNGATPGT